MMWQERLALAMNATRLQRRQRRDQRRFERRWRRATPGEQVGVMIEMLRHSPELRL